MDESEVFQSPFLHSPIVEHFKHLGIIEHNPASVYLVPPPKVGSDPKGRALTASEVRLLLELPKKETIAGARDYALILLMVRTFMRVSEAVSLSEDDFYYNQNSWFVKVKIKGGEVKNVPVPQDVKKAIDQYHFLDRERRAMIKISERASKFVFMPAVEKITRADATANVHLTSRHVWHLIGKYGEQLFTPAILKMKKENPNFSQMQLKKAFRLNPARFPADGDHQSARHGRKLPPSDEREPAQIDHLDPALRSPPRGARRKFDSHLKLR